MADIEKAERLQHGEIYNYAKSVDVNVVQNVRCCHSFVKMIEPNKTEQ